MAKLTIRSNHQFRDVLYWNDLTAKEQSEFDYLDTEDAQCEANFARYKGWVYDLSQFQSSNSPLFKGWQGFAADSYFSGVLICFDRSFEQVKLATYFS